ncbi:glycosyltransferase family 4 protein [Nitrosomonas sp. sh817]|uniref:glycosyltransferase family 4 protein n=1 Tax=Nitrosomonas sp. sh817 TaxID=3070658 RepID=UPI0027DD79C2|nr:glycosyltransferase family 4 protein [Nitrosomonas sp. sh817]WMJ09603.1 glycosyltransferase family 4 protein [Nitrosomonas sp. sh817]
MITVMLLGPSLTAVSGVSTHLNQLLQSPLADEFNLIHFQVGGEGRNETSVTKLVRLFLSPIQFSAEVVNKKPQIIHLNTSLEQKSYWRDIAYLLIAKALRKKVVYQVHGGALPQVFFKNSRFLTKILKWVLLSTDVVVLLSQEELHAYQDFVRNHNLKVIPNAIEIGEDAHWKVDLSLQNKPLQLIYVGRLAEVKGIFQIIEALAFVRAQGRDIRLVIAGSGPDMKKLQAIVNDKNLNAYASFAGAVYGEEKDRLWREADLFVFPTYHREGLPYAVLESMAARTPPIVSPVGAIPDVMEDGVHGYFVPSRDPKALAEIIERLDDDRALIRKMGQACRERIEDYYTVIRLAEDFRNLYRNLMK